MELSLIKGKSSVTVTKVCYFAALGLEFLRISHYILGKFIHSQWSPYTYQHYQINLETATANQCFSADCFQGSSACNGRVLATWCH